MISATIAETAAIDGLRLPASQYFAARSVTRARKASSAAVLFGHSARATLPKLFGERRFPRVPPSELVGNRITANDLPMPTPLHNRYELKFLLQRDAGRPGRTAGLAYRPARAVSSASPDNRRRTKWRRMICPTASRFTPWAAGI